jgi:hypothetical protein
MTDEHLEAIAERVADLLAERLGATLGAAPVLLDPKEVARRLGVSRDFVYEHSEELGAVRLGDGPRARLRFDSRRVAAFEAAGPAAPPPRRAPRPPRRSSRADLLPIAGEGER